MFDENYRALLIVNSTFPADRHNLPDLEGPRNDGVLLRDALCHQDAGMFPPGNVRLLPERTMGEVLQEVDDAGFGWYEYAPETYDAVVVTALAAVAADSDRPDEIARHINDVTRDGTRCDSFAECRQQLEAGENIDYDGESGPLEFSQPGEPTATVYSIMRYGTNNEIDPALTEPREVEY